MLSVNDIRLTVKLANFLDDKSRIVFYIDALMKYIGYLIKEPTYFTSSVYVLELGFAEAKPGARNVPQFQRQLKV